MSLSSNALCAKAKAMYGGRLNKNVYLDLTRKQTIGEVVSYLKSQTSYADALKDINIRHVHRGQIEDCLNQEYYHRCAKLMKYSPKSDEDFYLFEIIGVEINLIMDKLVSLQAKEQYSFNLSIPTYLAKKTSFNIDGLVNIESFKDLLQYIEAIETLKGNGPQDLEELCLKAGSTMLVQAKLYQDEKEAYKALQEVISNGKALEKLKEMVQRQGGDVSYIENPELFEKPSVIMEVTSKETGYVKALEAKNLGIVSMKLGGGRMTKDEDVDHAVGLVLNKKIGDHVEIGETLLTVYARNKVSQEIIEEIYQSYTIVDEFVEKPILVEEIMK